MTVRQPQHVQECQADCILRQGHLQNCYDLFKNNAKNPRTESEMGRLNWEISKIPECVQKQPGRIFWAAYDLVKIANHILKIDPIDGDVSEAKQQMLAIIAIATKHINMTEQNFPYPDLENDL